MALNVEDGTGLEDADAYVSIATADALLPAFSTDLTNWTASSVPEKEAAIIASTKYMDLVYTWLGRQLNSPAQALEFPRVDIFCDGVRQASDAIPTAIEEACSLLAVLHRDEIVAGRIGLFSSTIIGEKLQAIKKKSIKIGSGITRDVEYANVRKPESFVNTQIPALAKLLSCFLEDRGLVGAGRLGRL